MEASELGLLSCAVASPPVRRGLRRWTVGRAHVVAAAALLLIGAAALSLDRFATWSNAVVLLRSVTVVGLMALGETIVIVGGGIDLSQVVVAVVTTGVAAKAVAAGFAPAVGLAFGAVAALTMGLANGALIALGGIPPLFATLASGLLYLGLARLMVLPGASIYLPHVMAVPSIEGSTALPVVLLLLGTALTLHLFLERTVPGRFLRATGDNPRTAWAIGLPTRALTITAYGVAALTAFAAGLVMLTSGLVDLQVATSPMVFDVILIAVLGGASLAGGRGTISGTLAATIFVGVLLDAMTILDVGSELQTIAKGVALVAVLALDGVFKADASDPNGI